MFINDPASSPTRTFVDGDIDGVLVGVVTQRRRRGNARLGATDPSPALRPRSAKRRFCSGNT